MKKLITHSCTLPLANGIEVWLMPYLAIPEASPLPAWTQVITFSFIFAVIVVRPYRCFDRFLHCAQITKDFRAFVGFAGSEGSSIPILQIEVQPYPSLEV
jgi:hypothetical protein